MKSAVSDKRALLAKFETFKASILKGIDDDRLNMTPESLKGKIVYKWNEFCSKDFPLLKMKIQKDGKIGMKFDHGIVRYEFEGAQRDNFDKQSEALSKSLTELNNSLEKFANEHSDTSKRLSSHEMEQLFANIALVISCAVIIAAIVSAAVITAPYLPAIIPAAIVPVGAMYVATQIKGISNEPIFESVRKSFDDLKTNVTQNLKNMDNYITLGEAVEKNMNKDKAGPAMGA